MIDAMALLQSLGTIPATFADLAMKAFDVATAAFLSGSVRIDFVVDRYPTHRIKRCERSQRVKQGIVKINIANLLQKCPSQWKKYLSLDSNKTNLSEFLLQEWIRPEYAKRLHHRLFYVTHDAKCTLLTSSDGVAVTAQCVADLECCHEDAATRLLLHAAHAAMMGHASVVIRSPDTDATILACSLCSGIPARIFFRTGTKTRSRFIDIRAVRNSVSENVCDALLGLHALTGCDTTSAFKRRGKKTGLQLLQSNSQLCDGIQRLGGTFNVSDDLITVCETFVCQLYGSKTNSINDCRYELFSVKGAQGDNLPPTQDALQMHVQRANYQAAVWVRALQAKPVLPSPCGYGWEIANDQLTMKWMTRKPAPDDLLILVNCRCHTGCSSRRRSCVREGMPCTDACG